MVRNIQSSILSYINPQNALSGPSNTRPPSTVSPITPARPQSSLIHSSPYIPKRMNARIKVSEDELQSDDSEALSRIKMEEHKSRPYDEEPVDLVQRPMTLIEKREAKRRVLDSDDDAQAEDQVIILSDSEEDEWDTSNYTGRTKQTTGKYQRPSYYVDTNQSEHEEAINIAIALPSTKRKIHIQSDEEDEFLPDINTLISETPTRAAIPQTPNNGRITRSTDNPSSTRTTRATRAAQSRLVVTPPPPSSSLRQTIDGIFVPPTPSDRDSYNFSPRAAAATWRKSGIAVSSSPEIRNTRRRNLRSDNGKTVEMGSSLTSLVGVGGKAQTRSTRMSNKRVETESKAANGLVDEVEDEANDGDSDDNLVLKKGFSSRRGISNGEQLDPVTTEETSSRRTRSARVGKPPTITSTVVSPAKRKSRTRPTALDLDARTRPPQQQPFAKIPSEPHIHVDTDTSEDDQPVRKRMSASRVARKHLIADSDQGSGSDNIKTVRRKLKGKGKERVQDPDDMETSSEEEKETGAKLMAEIEMDSPILVASRLRDRGKQSAFQQNLDKLRARKLGIAGDVGGNDKNKVDKYEIADNWDYVTVEDGDDNRDDDIGGFIEDDGTGFDSVNLPIEFRMASFQSLQHHAKVIFQYFVNLAVAGDSYASEKDAAYYKVAFRAFEKKLNGIKDSTVTSSVWRPNFKRALESYPEFNVITLEEAVEGCDACHIGGRMSKFIGQLGGDKYDRKTFSILPPSPDSGSEDDDEYSFDRTQFRMGRYCRRRAEVFHDFSHWELAVYSAVAEPFNDLLHRCEGHWRRGGSAVVEGFTRRTIKDADKVLQWLEDRGVLDKEWHRISEMITAAENLEKNGGRGGFEDDS